VNLLLSTLLAYLLDDGGEIFLEVMFKGPAPAMLPVEVARTAWTLASQINKPDLPSCSAKPSGQRLLPSQLKKGALCPQPMTTNHRALLGGLFSVLLWTITCVEGVFGQREERLSSGPGWVVTIEPQGPAVVCLDGMKFVKGAWYVPVSAKQRPQGQPQQHKPQQHRYDRHFVHTMDANPVARQNAMPANTAMIATSFMP